MTDFDYALVDVLSVEGIDHNDAPDYCDAYILEATYKGKLMNDKQLERLNENGEFLYATIERELY